MRKSIVFVLLLIGLALFWVIREAPTVFAGEFGGIRIGTNWTDYFYIRGDELTCSDDPAVQLTTCETTLNGKTLRAVVTTPTHGIRSTDTCEIQYNGLTKTCTAQYSIVNSTRFALHLSDDLGITPQQMAVFRSQHPFLYYPESTWVSAAAGMMVVVTLLLLAFFWLRHSGYTVLRGLKYSVGGVVLFGLLWYGSMWILITLGYVD